VERYFHKQAILWKTLAEKYGPRDTKPQDDETQEKGAKPLCPVLQSTGAGTCPLISDKAHILKYSHKHTTPNPTTPSKTAQPTRQTKPDIKTVDKKVATTPSKSPPLDNDKRGSIHLKKTVLPTDDDDDDPLPPPSVVSTPSKSPPTKIPPNQTRTTTVVAKSTSRK